MNRERPLLRRPGLRNRAVRYGVRAAAIRGGGRLAADRVLRFRIGMLTLCAPLILLRVLLLLAPVIAVAGGGTVVSNVIRHFCSH